jgi:hypothetical protein
MFNDVRAMRVFYRDSPTPGSRYRQMAIVEKESFEVRIFHGDVVLTEPEWLSVSSDAEIYFLAISRLLWPTLAYRRNGNAS